MSNSTSGKTGITTHILDTTLGLPAAGVTIRLEVCDDHDWQKLAQAKTDEDGRARLLDDAPAPGQYHLTFEVAPYFAAQGVQGFYPFVQIAFTVPDAPHTAPHYHVPLLLNPFGYSTYRGS